MIGLPKVARSSALIVALALAPLGRAEGATPQPSAANQSGDGFVEPPLLGPQPEGDQPLRIVSDEPDPIVLAEPPPPAITPEPTPVPQLRTVDGRRPMPGTGLIALGALGMGASAIMTITALAGPGWGDMSRREAAIVGGLSLPLALASMGMVVGGSKSNARFERWADRNAITPPRPGNGIIVGGAAVTLLGVAGVGAGTQHAITDPTPARGNWAIVGASGAVTAIGLAILTHGMITRSKFAAWERGAYVVPGTMALEGGAGLMLSGRF